MGYVFFAGILLIIIVVVVLLLVTLTSNKANDFTHSVSSPDIDAIPDDNDNVRIIEISGVHHYLFQGNPIFSINEIVYLQPEPENKYDENAIQVVNAKGDCFGYIPKDENIEFLNYINEGYSLNARICDVDTSEPEYPTAFLSIKITKN